MSTDKPKRDEADQDERHGLVERPSDEPLLTSEPLPSFLSRPAPDHVLPQEIEPVVAQKTEPEAQASVPAEEAPPRATVKGRRTTAQEAARAARIILALMFFLVPVIIDPRSVDAFNLVKITAIWVLGLLSLAAWLVSVYMEPGTLVVPRGHTMRLAAILLGVTLLATLLSVSRTLSIYGLYHRYEGLASLAVYVGLAALLFVVYKRDPDALRDITLALAAAAGVVAAYVIFQKLGLDPFHWQVGAGAAPTFPIGNLGNSDFSSAFLGIASPMILYRAITAKVVQSRAAWGAVGLVVVIGLWLTQGRSGLLGAVAGLLAVVLFMSRIPAPRKMAAICVTMLFLALAVVVAAGISKPSSTSATDQSVLRSESVRFRAQTWDAAWHVFLNRPILGWGPETFFGNFGTFREPSDAQLRGLTIPDKPHNVFLNWADSTGLLGLLAYLLLIGTVLWRVAERTPDLPRPRRLLTAAFGGALVAYLVQSLYSIDVPPLAVMAWLTIAAITVLTEADHVGEPGEKSTFARQLAEGSWFRRSWVGPAIAGLVLLALIWLGTGPLRADHASWTAQRTSGAWSPDTLDLYNKSIREDPHEAAYRGLEAAYYEKFASDPSIPFTTADALKHAADLYEQALTIQPRNIYFMIDAVRVYARLGNVGSVTYFAAGDQWMRRAITLDPLDPQVRELSVDLLSQWAKKETRKPVQQLLLGRAQTQAAIATALKEGRAIRR